MKDLDKMADGTWVPPIKRLPEHPTYDVLLKHHEKETKILMETIQALAKELVAARVSAT